MQKRKLYLLRLLGQKHDQGTLAFILENNCLESSILVLETLNLQSSWIALLLTSHKHWAQAYKQTNKQEQLRTNTPNKKKA
jgi:hypothetical protein